MKELSIDEKVKAYDNLIERLKDFQFEYRFSPFSDDIAEKFPELKESEDERIRKALLELVHDTTGDELRVDYDVHKEEAVAWLEKQVPVDEDEIVRGIRRGVAISLINHIDANSKGMCLSNMECKDIENAIVNEDWDKVYGYMKKKLEKQGEPVEINPTEFDTRLQTLIGKFDSLPKEELIGSLSFWLNVVQNNGTYKPAEKQGENPAEWSEEDEKQLRSVLSSAKHVLTKANKEWLESLKERYAWKPSDEQMEILQYLCETSSHPNEKVIPTLESLYQDLKKLREE